MDVRSSITSEKGNRRGQSLIVPMDTTKWSSQLYRDDHRLDTFKFATIQQNYDDLVQHGVSRWLVPTEENEDLLALKYFYGQKALEKDM